MVLGWPPSKIVSGDPYLQPRWPPKQKPYTPAVAAAAAAAAIGLKFHPKHVTNKNKTKHIMKISHINVNIYDKLQQVNTIVNKMLLFN
jgi:hypothetical protein